VKVDENRPVNHPDIKIRACSLCYIQPNRKVREERVKPNHYAQTTGYGKGSVRRNGQIWRMGMVWPDD